MVFVEKPKKAPQEVKSSFQLWLVAIAAGIFEMAVVVIETLSADSDSGDGIFIPAIIRTVIFAALVYVITRMYRGGNWARIALAVLLGGFGTLSLIIDPIQWIMEGHPVSEAFADMDVYATLFGISRVVHLAAVITACILMFRPDANPYFRKMKSV